MPHSTSPTLSRPTSFVPEKFAHPVPPISPPETDADQQHSGHGMNHDSDSLGLSPPENSMPLFRRISTLAYNNSVNRDSRDRPYQRASRSLVLVIPPAFLSQAHGNTLALGPSARLSQGILMPLFSTMYAQLTAIAREFNFPSITGLCLYVQIVEGDQLYLPRISDESWGILWGHLFEGGPPPRTGARPISGRIEFDIDTARARWYDAWFSAPHRESTTFPSAPPSHYRQDSKSTSAAGDDTMETTSAVNGLRTTSKYIPKKLSLLDRADSSLGRSGSASQTTLLPGSAHVDSRALSPIPQEEEPKTANEKLNTLVKSWRANASITSNSLAATGQVSLDPVNLPNRFSPDESAPSAFNREDYAWSISSAGPPSMLDSPVSQSRVSSVHLDRRLVGSVCLTPSICTSFGPEDYDPFSPVSSVARLATPDIAMRMFEEVPFTPSTATSWGPPSEYPPSPMSVCWAPSVDLGERCRGSRPVTPSTAISWGAPLEYPPSPVGIYRAPSADLGERCYGSRPATPSTAISWGPPNHSPPTPTISSHVATPSADRVPFGSGEETVQYTPWRYCWPLFKPCSKSVRSQQSLAGLFVYPNLLIYPSVYPHFDIYPATVHEGSNPTSDEADTYPATLDARRTESSVLARPLAKPDSRYPIISIYPAVYPHFDIYPAMLETKQAKPVVFGQSPVKSDLRYPVFNIYPAVYPHFDIYPAILYNNHGTQTTLSRSPVKSDSRYPVFNIYPAVYPHFDIYPTILDASHGTQTTLGRSPVKSDSRYPVFNIYPAVYPHFDIYPTILDASHGTQTTLGRSPVKSDSRYPVLNIYPAVYPHFNIYPAILSTRLPQKYPTFDIRPDVYPNFKIYPSASSGTVSCPAGTQLDPLSVRLPTAYPTIEIYKQEYPHIVVYPAVAKRTDAPSVWHAVKPSPIRLQAHYPVLEICYDPPVYPSFDLYPAVARQQLAFRSFSMSEGRSLKLC